MVILKKTFLLLFFILLFSNTNVLFAQIDFPAFISDNMVLQQQTTAPIWGWGKPGENISITCSWDGANYQSTADSVGRWHCKVKTPKAGGPYKLTINNQEIKNILIGEVWICSGQSNMQWALDQTENSSEEIKKANYPQIRLFYGARQISDKPLDNCYGFWTECSPNTAQSFSAVAYYFGKKIHNELQVPIGLIHTSWGGTPAQAWIKKEVLQSDPDFNIYYERQRNNEMNAEPGSLPVNSNSPSRLYNAMIHPYIPFAIKGAIWYQGESNTGEAILYEKLFTTMITNWRNDWDQGDFPFYFVQLAPFNYQTPLVGAILRDSQRKSLKLINTGMAVTMDIGNPEDIHPRNKLDVGERLALWALSKDYNQNEIVFSGPLFKSISLEGNSIRVHFNNTGSGLYSKNEELTHFEIAGSDKIFYPAKALIDNETVFVISDKVSNPIAVRYAFHNTDEPNLFNIEGLPASSFRSDNWPIITETVAIKSNYNPNKGGFQIDLKTDNDDTVIKYTIDGTIPNQNSAIYNAPFVVESSTLIQARAFVDGTPSVSITKSEIKKHKATGSSITYINKYDDKYKGSGELELVNSLRGSKIFNDGRWQGFEENDLEVILDLGNIESINKVSLGCLQSIDSWIFFPNRIFVYTSEDGKSFNLVKELENDISDKIHGNLLNTFALEIENTSTRFIKIIADNIGTCPDWHKGAGGKAWLFVDEIVIE
jgi:sialate O-acetylesterase